MKAARSASAWIGSSLLATIAAHLFRLIARESTAGQKPQARYNGDILSPLPNGKFSFKARPCAYSCHGRHDNRKNLFTSRTLIGLLQDLDRRRGRPGNR